MVVRQMSVGIVVPTLNAAQLWPSFQAALAMQDTPIQRVLIMDSSSTDGTRDLGLAAGYEVVTIARSDFNHGRTRQVAAELLSELDLVVYLTQDAILASSDSIAHLLEPFVDPKMGAVYGRQLPRQGAGVIEAHARLFNYPTESVVRDLEYRNRAGFKAVFSSNSYAAYRLESLRDVGGFPNDVVVSEETIVFARMLLNGWRTAYEGSATVFHSHEYTIFQTLQRYFDIGVMHEREHWLVKEFGQLQGEGQRFLISEFKALWPRHFYLLPAASLLTLAKVVGYQLGLRERKLGPRVSCYLSQQKNVWAGVGSR
jgi:rhamnosyltransferase